MIFLQLFFCMSDDKSLSHNSLRLIHHSEASYLNFEKKLAIFHSVNLFKSTRRTKDNISALIFFYVDLDSGEKCQQITSIRNGPVPTVLIETKRGFHVYYKINGHLDLNTYSIIQKGLCELLGGDRRATDATRILRSPNFYHLKDPANPFLVRVVEQSNFEYSPQYMISFLKLNNQHLLQLKKITVESSIAPSNNLTIYNQSAFWKNVWQLNCKDALEALSGTGFVNFENYSFIQTASGNLNIYVNGIATSCWIDTNGRIGSLDGGGPTIYQWLCWYGITKPQAIKIIKGVFKL